MRRKFGIAEVRIIDETRNRLAGSEQSYTFYGRDVYAYFVANLEMEMTCRQATGFMMREMCLLRCRQGLGIIYIKMMEEARK